MRMKPSSSRDKPVSRAKAKNAAMLNLLATPGLGSLLCGRWIAGSGQLVLAVAGFTLVLVWFLKEMIPYYGMMFGDEPPHLPSLKMLAEGAILFIASWLWSAVTSVSLFREASATNLQSIKEFAAPPMPKLMHWTREQSDSRCQLMQEEAQIARTRAGQPNQQQISRQHLMLQRAAIYASQQSRGLKA